MTEGGRGGYRDGVSMMSRYAEIYTRLTRADCYIGTASLGEAESSGRISNWRKEKDSTVR